MTQSKSKIIIMVSSSWNSLKSAPQRWLAWHKDSPCPYILTKALSMTDKPF